jgi:hypothetical protein
MRILFLTDSLGGPRDIPDQIRLDDTWAHKVSREIGSLIKVEPIYLFSNGLETRQIRRNIESRYKLYAPDTLILQVGIVDCAPRVLSKTQLAVVTRLGSIGRIIHKVVSNNYAKLSVLRNISYVSISEFEENLRYLKEKFKDIDVISVAIAKPCTEYKNKSPLIEERYKAYNSKLKEIFQENFIDPYCDLNDEVLNDIFMSDNHHLNSYGHTIVAEAVTKYMFTKLER